MTTSPTDIFFDFDPMLPEELLPLARERAMAERADNVGMEEAAGWRARYWQPGRTLRVRFIGGTIAMHDKVAGYAAEWSQFANLHFSFGSSDLDAEIRVAFEPSRGNWSYIGTDATVIPLDKSTMNLRDLAYDLPESRYRRVILHEFGHVLGLIHEHQSPGSSIEWNEEAVKADLAPFNWTDDDIEFNVFLRFTTNHTQYGAMLPEGTEFDAQSIMIYPIPPNWTRSHISYPNNDDLSPMDKAFVANIYPKT